MAEKLEKNSSSESGPEHVEQNEKHKPSFSGDPDIIPRNKLNAMFENPLAGIPKDKLFADVEEFCSKFNLQDDVESFKKGALVAQNPHNLKGIEELNDEDLNHLEREHTHKWSQPATLYYLVIMCSLCAAVQGMDETANNGAQVFYFKVGFIKLAARRIRKSRRS